MVLYASPLATFVVDLGGSVVSWNPAAERLFGWKREEVLGQPLPTTGSGRFRNKQGQDIAGSVWTTPIRAANGAVRGTLWIAAERPAPHEPAPPSVQLALRR
jgi:PAS domain-containing protein